MIGFLLILSSNILRLHGNPGDYAWGSEGLDSIITQVSLLLLKELQP